MRTAESSEKNSDYLMVGIGASAGGLAPLKTLFSKMPKSDGMAFAVMIHFNEEFKSKLSEILPTQTEIPVIEVNEPLSVEAGHIYVAPPATQLELNNGIISVSTSAQTGPGNPVIDQLFTSLTGAYGSRSVGIILSGQGTDGIQGLKTIKAVNGVTLVQDPAEAEYPEMPQTAIAARIVDFVLSATEIPARLVELANNNRRLAGIKTEEIKAAEKKDNLKILIVDDHEDIRFTLGEALKLKGYEVRVASSGQEALLTAFEFQPDAAIIDLQLPDISGYEVAAHLREKKVNAFLIAYSGWGQAEDRQMAQENGFDAFLVKPAKLEDLEKLIENKVQ